MERALFALLTVFTGMLVGLHLAMNGKLGLELKRVAESDLRAAAAVNVFFWLIGAAAALLYFLLLRPGSPRDLFAVASKPLLLAGAMGASLILAATLLIPVRTGGAGPGFVLLVIGQILMGLLLSHFGWLGSPVDPFTLKKLLGLGLLSGGLYLTVAA